MEITLDTPILDVDDGAGTQEVVELIYRENYGHLDSKALHADLAEAIYDWLMDSDLHNNPTIRQLAAEFATDRAEV